MPDEAAVEAEADAWRELDVETRFGDVVRDQRQAGACVDGDLARDGVWMIRRGGHEPSGETSVEQ